MDEQFNSEAINDSNFKLLSAAALSVKIKEGIRIEDLYREAERKFDILIELLSDVYMDETVIARFGYSLNELKEVALLIFHRLIADKNSDPYMTLCVSEEASVEEIKRRRNKLLYIFHPDRNPEASTNGSITMRINEAFEIISNRYEKEERPFAFIKTRVPRYSSAHKKNLMIKLSIGFIIFFIGFIVFMKINNFF